MVVGTTIPADSEEEDPEDEDGGDESTGRRRCAPPAYAELSPHFGVLERAAEESGNVATETQHFTCRKPSWR